MEPSPRRLLILIRSWGWTPSVRSSSTTRWNAADVGKYANEGEAVFQWTKWVKDGQEKGYRNVASIKAEWAIKAAIVKAEADLGVVKDDAPPPDDEEQEIPF